MPKCIHMHPLPPCMPIYNLVSLLKIYHGRISTLPSLFFVRAAEYCVVCCTVFNQFPTNKYLDCFWFSAKTKTISIKYPIYAIFHKL